MTASTLIERIEKADREGMLVDITEQVIRLSDLLEPPPGAASRMLQHPPVRCEVTVVWFEREV